MKKLLTVGLIITVLMSMGSCQKKVMAIDKEKEKEAIKMAINGLLDAHARSDANTWLGLWVQEPYVFISSADSANHYYGKGFDVISNLYHGFWPDSLKMDEPAGLKLESRDFEIKVADSLARAVFYIDWSFSATDTIYRWNTYENYSMEKQEGGWKVATISAVNVSSYEE